MKIDPKDSVTALVAFDLDGTLADSAPDIARAVGRMSQALGRAAPGLEQVREWVGDGIRRLVKRALTGTQKGEPEPELYARAFESFRRSYRAHLAEETRLYPGALEVLRQLQERGYGLACITNKSAEFTEPLLAALRIREYFGVVLSGDSLPRRKPDPAPLLFAARHFKLDPKHGYMVGDSRNDLLAARAAGFRAIGVGYGYGQDLGVLEPDALLGSLTELAPLLEKWTVGLASTGASRYV